MASLASLSGERFAQSASVKRYERHRSASRLKPTLDPIIKCVELDYMEELQEILEANARHYTQEHLDQALHRAAQLGKSEACSILITNGSDINALEPPSRHEQRFDNSRGVFSTDQMQHELWLKHHTAVGGTALHLSVENGNKDTVKTLIEKGACLNIVDRKGRTPLMLASMRRGGGDVVRALVTSAECDVNVKEKQRDRTALHFAAESGDAENVQLLLDAGACVDAYDSTHNTALILTCSTPQYEDPHWPAPDPLSCVQLLHSHGAFINIFNQFDHNALSCAVQAGLTTVAQWLLQHSALLQPGTLQLACLEQRDAEMVQSLLAEGNSFQDEYLCALLLVLVSSMVSKWSFNARYQEENTHALARVLIRNISDPNAYLTVSAMSQQEMGKEFGDEFLNALDSNEHSYLQSYGFLGYALLKGKFSIAHMLYLAGCRHKLQRMKGNTHAVTLAKTDPYLREWLADALNESGSEASGDADVMVCSLSGLERVAAYDAVIHEGTHALIDQVYARREDSKALVAQTLLVYE